ncbi:MAG: hypothetical protein R3230_00390 [Nitrosopumilaceae archaeon]|nr:hypothetical protein [Nitrosopumilaceae archaeon]
MLKPLVKTFVIIASGPSLTGKQIRQIAESCEYHDIEVIAVNDNYNLVPWADHVFAADLKWWRKYYDDVCDTVEDYTKLHTIENVVTALFRKRETRIPITHKTVFRDVTHLEFNPLYKWYHGGNSGILAMELARTLDAKKIILVGFDFQHTDNKSHWFGDHPTGFLNANQCERWIMEIEKMMPYYEKHGIDVVNCSNETAINSIRKSRLEEEFQLDHL